MTKAIIAPAAEPAGVATTDVLIAGASIEAVAASASAAFAFVSIVVAVIALRAANRSERELRLVRMEDLTEKRISEFDSTAMVSMRKWIQTGLDEHARLNKCPFGGGLTQLNVGVPITIKTDDGDRQLLAGQICIRVLQFYGKVATQVTDKRVDIAQVVDIMADDIVATWRSLGPYLKHKTVGDYYRWFRRRYSMGSMAKILTEHEGFEERTKLLQARPSLWDFPRRMARR